MAKHLLREISLLRLEVDFLFSFYLLTFLFCLHELCPIALVAFMSRDLRDLVVEKCKNKWFYSGKQSLILRFKRFIRHSPGIFWLE